MADLMRAARLHKMGEKLRIDHVPIPAVNTCDVLVKVKACGICHSDINYVKGLSAVGKFPIILGHEIAGVVEEVGDEVENVKVGERVCVHYVLSCGECSYCQSGRENLCDKYQMIGKDVDGGFAEYIKVPSSNVLKLPESIPFEHGAIIGCAVSTAFHALKRGELKPREIVTIFGVGGVGIHTVQLAAKVFKAEKVIAIDISDWKLELAERLGANYVVNASRENVLFKISEATEGRLSDVTVDFTGSAEALLHAIKSVGKGGRLVIAGICSKEIAVHPYETIIGKEMKIIGVNDHLKREMMKIIQLASTGRLNLSKSITRILPLEKVNYGLGILERGLGNIIRIVLNP